jgi:hypothetical protein
LFEKTGIALGGGGSEGAGVYKYGFTASAPDFYHMHLLHKLKDDVE